MLGPPDGAPVHRLDVDEAGLPEPLEVEAHGVGVEPSRSARSWADRAAVERASSRYIAYRVSSPSAFSTASWSS